MTEERTIFITGATDGLGLALAHQLADAGPTLLLHGRDQQKLDAVATQIADQHGVSKPRTFRADLSSLAEVRRLADEVMAAAGRLDVFVSNAGIGFGEPDGRDRRTSADGYELRFAVNYLAGYLLTMRLVPLLRQSAPARIVYVASVGQHPLDFGDLMLERAYSGLRAYCQSKLAQIMSGFELADRLPADEVTVNSLHPATFMPTKMVLAERDSVDTLADGVHSTERLVTDPALTGVTGKFFERTSEARADPQAYDGTARARLWKISQQLTGLAD
ncbi:MAG: SDR family NAD(P)-dependent oxidoreductase [Actinobacteria bacterium]|nr:SDR family NAD(P)-dependent oxidoreductase [Actinomycetota bacterium]